MTLHLRYIPDVPKETAKVAKLVFRKDNRYMQMRDELGTLFTDKQLTGLFPNVGQLAESPWRQALVTVMQFTSPYQNWREQYQQGHTEPMEALLERFGRSLTAKPTATQRWKSGAIRTHSRSI